jgi:hypothetical protein
MNTLKTKREELQNLNEMFKHVDYVLHSLRETVLSRLNATELEDIKAIEAAVLLNAVKKEVERMDIADIPTFNSVLSTAFKNARCELLHRKLYSILNADYKDHEKLWIK